MVAQSAARMIPIPSLSPSGCDQVNARMSHQLTMAEAGTATAAQEAEPTVKTRETVVLDQDLHDGAGDTRPSPMLNRQVGDGHPRHEDHVEFLSCSTSRRGCTVIFCLYRYRICS